MISEGRKKRLESLKPNCISSTGKYCDFENHDIGENLTHDEILYLRKFHKDANIAAGYELQGVRRLSEEQLRLNSRTQTRNPRVQQRQVQEQRTTQQQRAQQPQQQRGTGTVRKEPNIMYRSKKRKPKFSKLVLQKVNKFANCVHKGIQNNGKQMIVPIAKLTATAAVVVVLGTSVVNLWTQTNNPVLIDPTPGYTYEEQNVAGTETIFVDYQEVSEARTMDELRYIMIHCDEENIEQWRRDVIEYGARIYNLDSTKCYEIIKHLTDNFQSPEYLESYSIENISCKGSGTLHYQDGQEALSLMHAMRVLSQDPQRFGINPEILVATENKYVAPTNYKELVFMIAKVTNRDPAFLYAVVQQESNFVSEYFKEFNNPAGIFFDGEIAEFPTIEAGFMEWAHEDEKYERSGAFTPEEKRDIHCPLNDKNDKYGLNQNWLPNVLEIMERVSPEFEQMEARYQAELGTSINR